MFLKYICVGEIDYPTTKKQTRMSSPQTKIFIFHWKTNAVSRHTSRFSTFGEFCCVHQLAPLCHALLETWLNSHTPRFREGSAAIHNLQFGQKTSFLSRSPPFPSLSLLLSFFAIWLPFLSLSLPSFSCLDRNVPTSHQLAVCGHAKACPSIWLSLGLTKHQEKWRAEYLSQKHTSNSNFPGKFPSTSVLLSSSAPTHN